MNQNQNTPRTKTFVTITILALVLTFQAFGQTYTVTDLGTLGGAGSTAEAINNSGVAVGWAHTAGGSPHAFAFTNGPLKDLGTLGGLNSTAFNLNDAGQIVGFANATGSSAQRAFLYNGSTMLDLGAALPGSTNSIARSINSSGVIVGEYHTANGHQRPFVYTNGVAQDLGFDGFANDINDLGQIVGVDRSAGGGQGFILTGGQKTYVGTLGGNDTGAHRINNTGTVIGNSMTGGGQYHAFVYHHGTIRDLGTLGGASSAIGGINSQGLIVGEARNSQGNLRAFIYRNGVMLDLNNFIPPASGWVLTSATAINDSGRIVGAGQYNGQTRAFLLIPDNDLSIALYAGLTINGIVGRTYRIDYLDAVTPSSTWLELTNIVLPTTPYLFLDARPLAYQRYYRSVLLP
ncbi:MAG TPA: HAF repeat-containing protein [Verrucomicrobiae bacterium]